MIPINQPANKTAMFATLRKVDENAAGGQWVIALLLLHDIYDRDLRPDVVVYSSAQLSSKRYV